ncbi:MAG: carboxypeptidase-like regulatory domain-containing protein [Chitinophagaceae bacterium]|nr:MAG: carboxypeptidase-like regulatory domain-containing protein [Chitinophagaceae bacterium]
MHRFLLTCLLFLSLPAFAQNVLRGVVLDSATKQPLAGASVFLSSTSVGTTANGSGEFQLSVPAGKFDLVVSAIDHVTFTRSITSSDLPDRLTVRLMSKAKEMETVVVQPYEKDGWKKWGDFFLENFIGRSEQGERCVLRNKETLRFRLDRKANTLTVVAREALLIDNKALGYRIRFQLEEFVFDFTTRAIAFYGFPLYEEMDAGAARERKWAKARREVYYGSLMHFMRAVYRNQLIEEGYTLYRVRKIPDLRRVARSQKVEGGGRMFQLDNGTQVRSNEPDDTLNAYQPLLAREPVLTLVDGHRLSGDSLAYAGDSATAILDFPNYISVTYAGGKTPESYQRTVRNGNMAMQSELTLQAGRPVLVDANGAFYNPLDLFANGWWGWSEKLGRLLPFDYEPE